LEKELMTESIAPDQELLLHAYLDGELSPADALAMERLLASEPALAARFAGLKALHTHIANNLPPMTAPPGLAARISSQLDLRGARPAYRTDWRKLAASLIVAAGVGSAATFLALHVAAPDPVPVAVTASHIRALMDGQPFEVASSDRHTVKPWFNGRIPQAPEVVDLASQGYPLAGGRVDVVGTTPVPTLVYRHRQHVISLTAVPASGILPASGERVIDGYNLLAWNENGVAYWAVSDLAVGELEEFARAFRAAVHEG
jgi:anti-sigma factor RsiW